MIKRWNVFASDRDKAMALSAELNVSLVLAQILLNRKIDSPSVGEIFLRADLEDCPDGSRLKGMTKACARIKRAIQKKEKIFVYGDYDVDGLTSCALLYSVLESLGANVHSYIPHRIEEGYGLNKEACGKLKQKNASLVITVDCGTGSFAEVEYLKSCGIDTIITDHHRPSSEKLPAAVAVINPWQTGCSYPEKDLAGVGIAYKLAENILSDKKEARQYLDLVALGTISDVAPLTGENRILVKHGLKVLSRTSRPGLKALIEVSGIRTKTLTSMHVGFMLGPRINASGRMGSAQKALQLLLSRDYTEAGKLAKELNDNNRRRQREEEKTLREALVKVEQEINFKHHRSVVLHSEQWHPGVIGIVASRLAERFYRPTFLISLKGEVGKGSGRSIRNFPLFESLVKCDHLLEEFGGHAKAAGISILRKNLADFKEVFNQMAHEMLDAGDLIPQVDIDMDIPLNLLSEKLITELELCEPFGMANPRPLFASRGLKLKSRPRALSSKSLRFWATDGKITCEVLGYRCDDFDVSDLREGFSLAYSPSLSQRHGISTIQLKLKDIQAG